jgi:hypothetical protein
MHKHQLPRITGVYEHCDGLDGYLDEHGTGTCPERPVNLSSLPQDDEQRCRFRRPLSLYLAKQRE